MAEDEDLNEADSRPTSLKLLETKGGDKYDGPLKGSLQDGRVNGKKR